VVDLPLSSKKLVIVVPSRKFIRERVKWFTATLIDNGVVAGAWSVLVGIIGTLVYERYLQPIYPTRSWLLWDLAVIWGWIAALTIGCLGLGQWLVVRVLRLERLPVLESAVFSMAAGVVLFVHALYLAGALRLYRPWFAVLLPAAFIVAGARHAATLVGALAREVARPSRGGPLRAVILAFGVICVGILWESFHPIL